MTDRKQISIFGSTGSIGVNTVDILLRSGGRNKFHVKVLSGGNNVKLLAEQAIKLQAELVVTAFSNKLEELNSYLSGSGIQTSAGEGALLEAACINCDWTMSSIVGAAGIKVGLKSLEHGGVLALANKETMVCAGDLAKKLVKKHQSKIIPVDSEHNAIFQCLPKGPNGKVSSQGVDSILLTASGGPFRQTLARDLDSVTPEQACAHPNWVMGKKISVDSATMMNKGLEVIEARWLFNLEVNQIDILIHPQSIIHSMVEFKDRSIKAQLGIPDMKIPIQSVSYTHLTLPTKRIV